MTWTEYFFRMALLASAKSKDPSMQVGCVVVDNLTRHVVTTGYNGFPRHVRDDKDRYLDRELKYQMVVHAELNAVCQAAIHGMSLRGCWAYVTFPPCSQCAAAFIQAGIECVNCLEIPVGHATTQIWEKSNKIAEMMFHEVGVMYILHKRNELCLTG
jgi:dCMP deaminase